MPASMTWLTSINRMLHFHIEGEVADKLGEFVLLRVLLRGQGFDPFAEPLEPCFLCFTAFALE